MLRNEYASEDTKRTRNLIQIAEESAVDPLGPRHRSCRPRCLPSDGSGQVRPNVLQGWNCDKLSPYYSPSPRDANTSIRGKLSQSPDILYRAQNSETNVAKSLDSPKKEECSVRVRKDNLVPPQGMDTGSSNIIIPEESYILWDNQIDKWNEISSRYPKGLFYQYYPIRNETYTFDLLPLPFLERLNYQDMYTVSMNNEDIQKKWKDYLYGSPSYDIRSTFYPDDKFWRWNKYLRYTLDENANDFTYKMQAGPKYDDLGRLPVACKDLQIFREIKTKLKTDRRCSPKKGDGRR